MHRVKTRRLKRPVDVDGDAATREGNEGKERYFMKRAVRASAA